MSAAVEHTHCNTNISNAQLLPEGIRRDGTSESHQSMGIGRANSDTRGRKYQSIRWGAATRPSSTAVYVGDYLRIRAQHADGDKTALIASASLAPDHVRLFGTTEAGVTPIIAPIEITGCNTQIDALGFTINFHNMTIFFPVEKQTQSVTCCLLTSHPAAGKPWNAEC